MNSHDDANDVVITGYGLISPLGHSPELFYQGLAENRSAVSWIDPLEGVDGTRWTGALIRDFDPKLHVQPRKTIKVMCREIQLAFAASMQACKMANLSAGIVEPDRLGTVFTGEIIMSDIEDMLETVQMCSKDAIMNHSLWGATAMDQIHPLWMLKSLPNMAACHVGIALDARGPNNTITTENTSGLVATMEAMNVIRRGKADVMIVGSSASRTCFSRLLQRYEEDYSHSDQDPSTACRPFDAGRAGAVPAESSASIVLERRSHAVARNATIIGTIDAFANVFCGAPKRWAGAQQATENAIQTILGRSDLSVKSIDHVNSAANGSIAFDSAQSHGIRNTLGQVPVVSYQGAIGDSISGSGIIELIASLIGMQQGHIAPTVNHEQTAEDCPIQVISGRPKPRTASHFLKLSNTPHGHCAAVLVRC